MPISRQFRRSVEQVIGSTVSDVTASVAGLSTSVAGLTASLGAIPAFVPLAAPLTSTSWDGDARSTTAKTLVDLEAVFNVPAGAKAILVRAWARDSGSSGGAPYLGLAPNNTAGQFAFAVRLDGQDNDEYMEGQGIVPCDANGDVYYQCGATGANTLDVYLQIWGYWV